MHKTVKAAMLFVICSHLSIFSPAQIVLKLPTSSSLPGEIKKLIADYPNHFSNILGDEIEKNPQSVDYNCLIKISDAENLPLQFILPIQKQYVVGKE